MATKVNPLDELAIRNTLSRYCEALDMKMFDLLDKVFLPDVVASYPFNPDLKGVDQIRTAIINRLGPIKTHHNLTTSTIVFSQDAHSATAITYFQGVHLGQGPHAGKTLTAYGKYQDELACLEASDGDLEGVNGASGVWRIKSRTVAFSGRIGDEAIMKEF
ncbi:hypothetical protein EJ04DRAFT_508001 [Polyplosphaeria fusca]|uniref:SnoaL-like domain-containing protein n=1 Tax=Polyplosphaeria fusca TaxID=682080 RepID=A0A9P4V8D5_9PLEO|nr:hypothetical protein EJ04DRAFT_508001 [Polyplosphaeria fusca]